MGAQNLIGHRLLDRDGNSVGKIGQVFFDDQTDQPKWVTVRTGLLGSNENFVPLRGARMVDDALRAAYTTEQIRTAPSFAIDEHLSVHQEDMIYQHYGLGAEVPAQRGSEERPRRQRGRHARPGQAADATPAGYREHAPEPVERAWVANMEERRPHGDGDPSEREREGVRVFRPESGEPPSAS
ncbi:PRC-barrel domain containing protein [Halostreptopolyspora alba]|uniref:PRC-barrel domain containing protein n=2 Tax=Halostreptopolyspora alba TaxID=2487137 RepID=A0A3N0E2K8_9ACTN|nr:PRC-barrel domain containing protein [Nocardiopsaceae bacterium YIM 96095]